MCTRLQVRSTNRQIFVRIDRVLFNKSSTAFEESLVPAKHEITSE